MKKLWRKRLRRERRVRGKVMRVARRPRLTVHRSHLHFSAQVIDDATGRTLTCASTLEGEMRGKPGDGVRKSEEAKKVGELLARRTLEKGIRQVALDRGRFAFHGRVKAFAEAARAAGLDF
ncbi:MAG TPA: 50S ribosomal protein L18 [Planctomycetota bacterium]|nr:50S ribosomal protein L18 [Planctomycetota bacterium]